MPRRSSDFSWIYQLINNIAEPVLYWPVAGQSWARSPHRITLLTGLPQQPLEGPQGTSMSEKSKKQVDPGWELRWRRRKWRPLNREHLISKCQKWITEGSHFTLYGCLLADVSKHSAWKGHLAQGTVERQGPLSLRDSYSCWNNEEWGGLERKHTGTREGHLSGYSRILFLYFLPEVFKSKLATEKTMSTVRSSGLQTWYNHWQCGCNSFLH